MVRVEIKKVGAKYKAALMVGVEQMDLICLSSNLSRVRQEAAAAARREAIPCLNCVPEPDMHHRAQGAVGTEPLGADALK